VVPPRPSPTDDNTSEKTIILYGMTHYSVATFAREIRGVQRWRTAQVVETECYTQRSVLGVTHRFLVLRVKRDGKKDLWIRLDRLVNPNVGVSGLLSRSCKTSPHDTVGVACRLREWGR
jgi:hypothetical protein